MSSPYHLLLQITECKNFKKKLLNMNEEIKKSSRAKYDIEDDEDSEVSFSIAYEKLVDDLSEAPSVVKTREKENLLEIVAPDFSKETILRKGRPYKVCGGKSKDRKGIVAVSFKELVEKGKF